MKKKNIFSLASMCALLLVAAGCSNEDEITGVTGDTVTINVNSTIASIGDNTTRATLNEDGKTPHWEMGDVISVKVDNGDPLELTLTEIEKGDDTQGYFRGIIPSKGEKMYLYYPSTASSSVDLTNQDGSNTKEMVMYGCTAYNTHPSVLFENKTSILKLNMAVPDGIEFLDGTELFVKVTGAFSKGVLDTNGDWKNCTSDVINVTNAKIVTDVEGKKRVSAYVVVIPNSKVKNLRIHVGGKVSDTEYKNFATDYYTSNNTIAVNEVVTIEKTCATIPANFQVRKTYSVSDYYMWDAEESYSMSLMFGDIYNPTPFSSVDKSSNDYADYDWARHCPTYEQFTIMIGNQPYWDTKGGSATMYYLPNNETKYAGIWLKKLVYCDISKKLEDTNETPDISVAYRADMVPNDIRTSGEYFFLPTAGYYSDNQYYKASYGNYWSSTPMENDTKAYVLEFSGANAYVRGVSRSYGFLPMVCE